MNETPQTPENITKEEYLTGIAGALMADPDWEFPQDMRFFLVADLEWTLLGK